MIALIHRLKRQTHRDVAKAQDLIVDGIYSIFNNAVMHGGTAIWRCYQGNRFSEDIDMYLPKDTAKIELFFEKLQQRGFHVLKKKIGENSLYLNLRWNQTEVRFEALFKKIKGHLREYETVEGNSIPIYTLTTEELIEEKVRAYLGRRKVRDLYDIYVLLKKVSNIPLAKKQLILLREKYQPPLDEAELKLLILDGLVPSAEKMKEYLQYYG